VAKPQFILLLRKILIFRADLFAFKRLKSPIFHLFFHITPLSYSTPRPARLSVLFPPPFFFLFSALPLCLLRTGEIGFGRWWLVGFFGLV